MLLFLPLSLFQMLFCGLFFIGKYIVVKKINQRRGRGVGCFFMSGEKGRFHTCMSEDKLSQKVLSTIADTFLTAAQLNLYMAWNGFNTVTYDCAFPEVFSHTYCIQLFLWSYLDRKARCSRNLSALSFVDKTSNNSKQTKLVRVASAWAANPVSNLKSQWTAPEDTAHGVFCRTSKIASSSDLLKDDVETVDVLWALAFLEDKKERK